MSDQRIRGLSALLDPNKGRLPINRKERYYTGTVLPMIVAADGFKRLGRFLKLCSVPAEVLREVDLDDNPESTNVQFFTEYGFKESLKGGAELRYQPPGGRDTPDLVVYVEGEPPLLLGVEAKMFDRPSPDQLREQLAVQERLLQIMAAGIGMKSVHQAALLPTGLCESWRARSLGDGRPWSEQINVPVLTWEEISSTFLAPPYWIRVLAEALDRYDDLKGGQPNYDAMMVGRKIYESFQRRDSIFRWMGRKGGLDGSPLQEDVESGGWKTRDYRVRHFSPLGKRNWFKIDDFVRRIDSYRRL